MADFDYDAEIDKVHRESAKALERLGSMKTEGAWALVMLPRGGKDRVVFYLQDRNSPRVDKPKVDGLGKDVFNLGGRIPPAASFAYGWARVIDEQLHLGKLRTQNFGKVKEYDVKKAIEASLGRSKEIRSYRQIQITGARRPRVETEDAPNPVAEALEQEAVALEEAIDEAEDQRERLQGRLKAAEKDLKKAKTALERAEKEAAKEAEKSEEATRAQKEWEQELKAAKAKEKKAKKDVDDDALRLAQSEIRSLERSRRRRLSDVKMGDRAAGSAQAELQKRQLKVQKLEEKIEALEVDIEDLEKQLKKQKKLLAKTEKKIEKANK